jgi:3-oxoacyl-(acyl-carrier-protein) synthase
VQLRPGSVIWIPRALKFNRFVAGQLPTGWDAERYGAKKTPCFILKTIILPRQARDKHRNSS